MVIIKSLPHTKVMTQGAFAILPKSKALLFVFHRRASLDLQFITKGAKILAC